MSKHKSSPPAKDNSPKIQQREKFKSDLNIREFNWTEKQKQLIEIILNKNTNFTFIKGPAGVSKTLISVYCGLRLLHEKRVSQIVYVRNPVESSSYGLGFLSGDLNEKFGPYEAPMQDKLEELLTKPDIASLENDNRIISIPLGFMRGLSLRSSYIIIEEASCLTVKDLLLVMTRVSNFSKCIIAGDIMQSDIKHSGFEKVFNAFDTEASKTKGIQNFKFDKNDIMRSPVLSHVIETFERII